MTVTEAAKIDIPDTPVGRRVQWVLDSVNRENEVSVEQVKEAFAESFLAAAPAEAIAGMLNNDAAELGTARLVGLSTPTDFAAVVDMSGESGAVGFRLKIMVEQDEPNRIAMLGVEPVYPTADGAKPRDWSDVSGGEPVREERGGPGAVDEALSAELEELIAEAREENHFVGLAASIGGRDGLVWFRGFGSARAPGTEVLPDSVFRIGSVSKTITAVGVMQLVEAGKVALDDPINDHLKSYKVQAADGSEPITIRHLLTHVSGLGARGGVDIGIAHGQPVPPLAEFYASGLVAKTAVGTEWAYSNDAFATLGHLIEELNGKPFYESMEETFFGPLGMKSSSFFRHPHIAERLVTGFSPDGDSFVECLDLEVIVRGAGSVFSTAEDMARYTSCLINGGAPVLKKESLEEMWAAQGKLPQEGMNGHQGLSFIVHDVEGHRVPWHNGGWPGAATSMYVAPDDGRSVVLTANLFGAQQSPALDALGMRIIRRLLGLSAS
ncbi:MAG TPA: serine hydrolase [Acidimicrobiales bacterium]|nr:serine hydrolase [Acidimicrobiales bacterium]